MRFAPTYQPPGKSKEDIRNKVLNVCMSQMRQPFLRVAAVKCDRLHDGDEFGDVVVRQLVTVRNHVAPAFCEGVALPEKCKNLLNGALD